MASVNNIESRLGKEETTHLYTFEIAGDANTYYPVWVQHSNGKHHFMLEKETTIYRSLGEKCNNTYAGNHSNGTSSLAFTIKSRNCGWDGNANRSRVTTFQMPYANLVGGFLDYLNSIHGFVVWLRGGGTVYHISSNCELIRYTVYMTNTNIGSTQYPTNIAPKTSPDSYEATVRNATQGASVVTGSNMYANYFKSFGDITGNKVYNAVWNDYAEFFERGEQTEPGDIIALDLTSSEERYIKATRDSKVVVGVHSDSFAHLIGGENPPNGEDFYEYNIKKFIPVGLAGRVKCKIIGPIKKGDYIAISDIRGVGIALSRSSEFHSGYVIGISLEDKDTEGIGLVKILVK